LRFTSGHVWYGIRPSERKKWYVTIWLKLALEKCKELWLDKVLLTCDTDNIGSSKTIIKNWWVLDSEYEDEWVPSQRYWISIR
jgi:predicted acetyltransferase